MLTMTNVPIIKHKCTTTIEWAVVEQSHRKKGVYEIIYSVKFLWIQI